MYPTARQRSLIPAVAAALAIGYFAAVALGPWALAAVVAAAAVGGSALVLTRRASANLRALLVAIAAWLAVGLAAALLLHRRTLAGFAWVLLVLYLLPLPVVPFLYARTFDDPEKEGKGKREKGKGTTGDGRGRRRWLFSLFIPGKQVRGKEVDGGSPQGATGGPGRLPSSLSPLPSSLFPFTPTHGPRKSQAPTPSRGFGGAR